MRSDAEDGSRVSPPRDATGASPGGGSWPSGPFTVVMVAACPFPEPRGTPVRILRMAEGLARRGHRVHVVTYHYGTGSAPASLHLHRIASVTGYRRRAAGPTYTKLLLLDPLLTVKLAGVIRRHRPDIVHAHHTEGLIAAAVARVGTSVPLVYDAHTLLASELPFYGMGLPTGVKRFLGERLDRWLPALADHVIGVTEKIREKLVSARTLPADRVSVITNGVELELFEPPRRVAADDGNRARSLIFTGNLAAYQGIDLMLRALREVRERRNDVRLVIASESSFDPYEELARELGVRDAIDVRPASFADVPRLLAAADVALNPRTECDGIPLKLLNYMAAGRPVVSFAGSAPGVLHGQTGWVVANEDVAAFAEGALRLLADDVLAARLGENARRYVAANRTWAATAAQTEEVYRRLLADRQGGR